MLLVRFDLEHDIVSLQIGAPVVKDGEQSKIEMLAEVKQFAVDIIVVLSLGQKDGHVSIQLKPGCLPLQSRGEGGILKLTVGPHAGVEDS